MQISMDQRNFPLDTANVRSLLVRETARIVSAFVGNNHVPATTVGTLLEEVANSLAGFHATGAEAAAVKAAPPPRPAVDPERSVTDEWLVCLEDGKRFKTLKRHLSSRYGLSPQQYRKRWNLPDDYPMVSPNYQRLRSSLAQKPRPRSARVTQPVG